jgi:hypothetical protein
MADWNSFIEARLAEEEEFLRIARRLAARWRSQMENELAGKREILGLHHAVPVDGRNADGDELLSIECAECDNGGVRDSWPCPTIRALARFWADHRDYPGRHENTVV